VCIHIKVYRNQVEAVTITVGIRCVHLVVPKISGLCIIQGKPICKSIRPERAVHIYTGLSLILKFYFRSNTIRAKCDSPEQMMKIQKMDLEV
jgi:hypothetical protein